MAEPRAPLLFIRCHYVSYWIIGFFPDDGRNSLTKSQWSWLQQLRLCHPRTRLRAPRLLSHSESYYVTRREEVGRIGLFQGPGLC